MVCLFCGGQVIWRGPLSNLTHTECDKCGRYNCQIIESDNSEDEMPQNERKQPQR